jgi:hypothetical protein
MLRAFLLPSWEAAKTYLTEWEIQFIAHFYPPAPIRVAAPGLIKMARVDITKAKTWRRPLMRSTRRDPMKLPGYPAARAGTRGARVQEKFRDQSRWPERLKDK